MISLAVYILALLLFVLAFVWTRLAGSIYQVADTSRKAIQVLGDSRLDDDAKEHAARNFGLKLLHLAVVIAIKGAIAFIAAILPFWIADELALEPWEASTAFALRWDVLVITLVAGLFIWYLLRRIRPPAT